MAPRRRLRVLGIPPGAAGLRAALTEFRKGGAGVATAFSDASLKLISGMLEEGADVEVNLVGEVMSRALKMCDEHPPAQARSGHYLATLALACGGLDPDSPFKASGRFPGFHRALAKTLKELHGWQVGVEALESAAERSDSAIMAAKFRALAELDREATQTLAVLGREPGHSHLVRSLECRPSKHATMGRLFVAALGSDEPLSAKWLGWLADSGMDVTVAVDLPYSGLFGRSATFVKMLGAEIEPFGAPTGLSAALFSSRQGSNGVAVTIESAADMLAEAEWAIRGCLRDIESGMSPDEFGLYVRDIEGYAPFLSAAARRFNVKLRMSLRAPVLTNRWARLTLATLDFCAGDDPRQIGPLLHSSYLGLSRKDREEIRSEARNAFRAKHNAWPVFLGWSQANEQRWPWLRRLLQWRDDASKTPVPLYAWADRLRTLMDLLPLFERTGEGPTRHRDLRAMSALQRAVAQAASVRRAGENAPVSLAEFASLSGSLWAEEEYTLPSESSGIAVASQAEALGELKSLTALGMLEGVFPKRRSEDPILSDGEREELSRLLVLEPPLPTSVDKAKQEREAFVRLAAAPTERLTLSYPQTDDLRDNVPAFYLVEVERAAGEIAKHDHPRVPFAPPTEECLAKADRSLREALNAPHEEPFPNQLGTSAATEAVSWPEIEPFGPHDLRDAIRCEFQHLARSRLKLRPTGSARRWSHLRSLPQKAQLLRQPSPELAEGALLSALEAELDQWYGDAPDWELAMLRSGGRRLIRDWVQREFAARAIWPKDDEGFEINPSIGDPGLRDKMPGGIPMAGRVAAISKMGPYVVTHLYENRLPKEESKFGGVLPDPDLLYYGLHLLSRHTPGFQPAVEVESMTGGRRLLLTQRMSSHALPSRRQDGLEVVDLSSGGDGALAVQALFEDIKRRLARASSRLRAGGIEPMPGDHCAWCSYGELCRRSSEYGETDSLFEGGDDEAV